MRHSDCIKLAYERGYRVIDGKFYNPKGGEKILRVYKAFKYPIFTLSVNGKDHPINTHKFAAYCYYGDNAFTDGLEVRHLNGNVLDISKDNIILGTTSENMMDKPKEVREWVARKARKAKEGNVHYKEELTEEQVVELRNLYDSGITVAELSRRFNTSYTVARKAALRMTYKRIKEVTL